jgi:hypothetical protein
VTPTEVHALAVAAGLTHDSAVIATAIAWAESGLRPDAVGDRALVDNVWGPSIGLWQIRSLHVHTGTAGDRDANRLLDPAFNARSMATISAGGTDWSPWSVWKNGRYRDHLEAVRAAVEGGQPVPITDIIRAAMDDPLLSDVDITWVPDWESRGRPGSFEPKGLVAHHTADRAYGSDYAILSAIRDGIDQGGSWLPGPLAQFGLGRDSTVYVVAAGKANHAGPGSWGRLSGNGSVWGIEAANDGIGEPWPARQVAVYLALIAALARATGFGAADVCRHEEWSTAGKIDPYDAAGRLSDGGWIRSQVSQLLANRPTPTPTPQEVPDMFIFDGPDGGIFYTDGATWKRGVPNGDALEPWRRGHVPHLGQVSREYFDALPDFRLPASLGLVSVQTLPGPLADYAEQEPLGCAAEDAVPPTRPADVVDPQNPGNTHRTQ